MTIAAMPSLAAAGLGYAVGREVEVLADAEGHDFRPVVGKHVGELRAHAPAADHDDIAHASPFEMTERNRPERSLGSIVSYRITLSAAARKA